MEAGREDAIEVANYAAHLPRGSAVQQWLGGWQAITAEEEAIRRLEYMLNVQIVQASGKKRKVPEPQPPKSIRDAEQRERDNVRRKADKRRALAAMARTLQKG